jgi:hypothetical protein
VNKTSLTQLPAPRSELAPAFGSSASRSALDEELLESIRQGDLDGLAGLYDLHGPECLRAALASLRVAEAAESLVFEVFLMTWREPPGCGASIRQLLINRTLELAQQFRA